MHKCLSCNHEWLRGTVFHSNHGGKSYSFRICPKCSKEVKVKKQVTLKIKSRKQVVEYLNSGKCYEEAQERYHKSSWHFGKGELRCLLDFIYNEYPNNDAEKLINLDL